MIGRMTAALRRTHVLEHDAAMEPADDRPDDMSPVVPSCGTFSVPQWSRPMIGRMTRMFVHHAEESHESPQWSRPMIGRMTPGRRVGCPECGHAAMEPADDRPD